MTTGFTPAVPQDMKPLPGAKTTASRLPIALSAAAFVGWGAVDAPSLAASPIEPAKGDASAEPVAYHWQQGVWFAFPTGYRNPYLGKEVTRIIQDRSRVAEGMKRAQNRTGFAGDGRYDRNLVSDTEAVGGFAFKLDTLEPVGRNLFFDADITGDPENPGDSDVVKFKLVWAGGDAPKAPPDVTRRFDRYQASRGKPPSLRQGHLTWLSLNGLPPAGYQPLPPGHSSVDYKIYEQADGLTAIFRCNVMDETLNRRGIQPICDGEVSDADTGTILYLTFPEHLIWSELSWLLPSAKALSLVNSWRLEE
ncbi:hypothetical protein [Cribrihabitans neustonicus]|uniref:hypothetical protein n=1 Tax=Cribrihabitans neustonicus TaxID=1429085 RepID=UPI003B5CE245